MSLSNAEIKLHQQIDQYLKQSQFEQGIESCYQYLKNYAPRVSILRALGISYQHQSDVQQAFYWYTKALEIQPDAVEIYTDLGNYYFQSQQWSDAATLYQVVNRLQPSSQALYHLGHTFIQLKQWESAVQVFQNLVQLKPDAHEVYYSLGHIFSQLQSWNDALVAYQKATQIQPDHCWYHYELGNTLTQLKKFDQAILSYKQAIQIDPHQDWFYQNLAEAFSQINQFDQSIQAYQQAIRIQPQSWYYLATGKVLICQQKWEEAIQYLVQSLSLKPDEYEVFVQLGNILSAWGDPLASLKCQTEIKLPDSFLEKYFKLPQNWQTSLAIESSISLTRIYPEDHANLSPAKTLSSQEHPLFQVQAVQSFAPSVAVIPQGRVWADALNIAVLNVNNQIISELSQGCGEIIFSIEKRARPQSISGRIALLSVQFGLVYYHWILDVLPRFHLLSQLGYLFNTIDGFVVNQYDYPYEKESLELLGIPQNKIIESRTLSAIQTTELIVPFWPSQPSIKPPIWAIKFLRDTFLPYALAGSSFRSDCLYISRKNASCRRLTNESEVINLLQKYHFKAVQLEQFSLREQIAILQQARTVVSAHGSGLTNIVFCNPGTKIVEILSPIWINSCYWHLSSLSGLDYYYLLGEVDEESVSTSVNRQDFRVDLSALAQVLQLAQIS